MEELLSLQEEGEEEEEEVNYESNCVHDLCA